MAGVEFGRFMTIRLARQFYDLYAENFGKLPQDAHAIEWKATCFDL